MALIMIESWESYAATADLPKRGNAVTSATEVILGTTTGPSGGHSLNFGGTGSDFNTTFNRWFPKAPVGDVIRVAFWAYWASTIIGYAAPPTNYERWFLLRPVSASFPADLQPNLSIHRDVNGLISVLMLQDDWQTNRDIVPGATTSIAIDDDAWHRVEVYFLSHASAGACKIWIDGVLDVDVSGVQTMQNTSTVSELARLELGNGAITTPIAADGIRIGPYVIWDDDGSEFTGELGTADWDIAFGTTDGAGASTDFTPSAGSNYQNVDEAGYDEDTTYNESSTASHRDLHTFANFSLTNLDAIKAVHVTTMARNTGAGTTELRGVSVTGATTDFGTTISMADTVWTPVDHLLDFDPDTSAEWTQTGLNAAVFGYENTSTVDTTRVSKQYVEVLWTAGAGSAVFAQMMTIVTG